MQLLQNNNRNLQGITILTTSDPHLTPAAQAYAKKYDIPYRAHTEPSDRLILELTDQGLQLIDQDSPQLKPLRIDFNAHTLQHRIRTGGKSLPLAKAIGVSTQNKPTVLDLTAGLGRDAFILASLGCQVTMIERSPITAAMLDDALRRVQEIPASDSLTLVHGDSQQCLQQLKDHPALREHTFDTMYLDPMFPESKKSALVKKDMQYLRALSPHDNLAALLLQSALDTGVGRVVLKQPRVAGFLTERKPSFQIKSKTHRFDVYLTEQTTHARL
jgi:16S rRNA (guanine1516-N2)-methyltransferase